MKWYATFHCECGQCKDKVVGGRFDRYDIICMCGKRMYPVMYMYDIHFAISKGKNAIPWIDEEIERWFKFRKPEYWMGDWK